jgi:microcystin-dependent protein
MTDFQLKPALSDLYTEVFTTIRSFFSALAKMDYTGFTNLPDGAIRYNKSTQIWEEYDSGTSAWGETARSATITAHIANGTIHEARHVGSMEFIAYSTPDSGWLLCNGQAVSRTTYATLFAKIGTKYGVGDGSTSFNVPNLVGRLAIGVDASVSALNDLGKTAGSWDHTHTTPNHTHTIASHTHTMANHTHTVGAHSHTIPTHSHSVPAHYHDVKANGGTINITSSGSHNHNAYGREGGSNGSDADRAQGASSSSGSDVTWTSGVPTGGSNHTHGNASFTGTVGNTSGSNGDSSMTTGGSGTLTSDNSSSFASGAPSNNTTDGSGILTSNGSEGGGTTGTANPPVLTGWWQIKY